MTPFEPELDEERGAARVMVAHIVFRLVFDDGEATPIIAKNAVVIDENDDALENARARMIAIAKARYEGVETTFRGRAGRWRYRGVRTVGESFYQSDLELDQAPPPWLKRLGDGEWLQEADYQQVYLREDQLEAYLRGREARLEFSGWGEPDFDADETHPLDLLEARARLAAEIRAEEEARRE